MIAQVALTIAVWIRMYAVRFGEIKRKRIDLQHVATSRSATRQLEDTTPADNFRNLFEVPVLFFSVCLALAVSDAVTMPQLVLAWTFVFLRAVHSLIHVTYNRVAHRFAAYVLGTVVVLLMWLLFAVELMAGGG